MTIRALSIAAALCASLALAACGERSEPEIASTPQQGQFEITGRWHGELTQQGTKPFSVQARIASLERFDDNVVHYSEIDCTGTWEYLGASETAYRFRERIDSGQSDACKGSGTVSLTPVSDDRVDYEFRGGAVVSRGTLDRVLPAN
jgi:hypothetical protein